MCDSLPTTLDEKFENDTATLPTRCSLVTFAPLPPPHAARSASRSHARRKEDARCIGNDGFRADYSIGDTIRSPSHMIIAPTPEQAFEATSSLRKHAFAFVKRTDGSYSYAILAFRSLEPPMDNSGPDNSLEEYMGFVMCGDGSTKKLRKKHWGNHVRLVSMHGLDHLPTRTISKRKRRGKVTRDDWVPPNIISFVPATIHDDDCSLLDGRSIFVCTCCDMCKIIKQNYMKQ